MFREMGYGEAELEGLLEAQFEYFSTAMVDGRLHGWVAREDGRLVGTVELDLRPVAPGPVHRRGCLPYVYGLFVVPGHRRRGIAGTLMEAARAWVDAEGYDGIRPDLGDATADGPRRPASASGRGLKPQRRAGSDLV
jgi:GNAT superfamily N-acetyltransferase